MPDPVTLLPCIVSGMPFTRAGYMERYTKSLAKQAVGEYAQVAQKHGLTPTQLALAWCKSRWNVASTIIGATSLEQLKVGKVCRNELISNFALPFGLIIMICATR